MDEEKAVLVGRERVKVPLEGPPRLPTFCFEGAEQPEQEAREAERERVPEEAEVYVMRGAGEGEERTMEERRRGRDPWALTEEE